MNHLEDAASLEVEREKLLTRMGAHIDPGLLQRIEAVECAVAQIPRVTVAVSHSGAADASPE